MKASDLVISEQMSQAKATEAGKLIRIVILYDHAMIRTALRVLIEMHPRMIVVGEAGNGAEALAVTGREQPDIVLLDLAHGNEDELDIIPGLCSASRRTRVLVLTSNGNTEIYTRAVLLGAVGVLQKDNGAEVLIKALEKISEGEAWIDRSTLANVLAEISRRNEAKAVDNDSTRIASLTPRERQVISLVCAGLKNKQIAERLFISESTVRHHLSAIFSKLELSGRFDLIIYAHRHELTKG
jgi:DNA-binding NarL/FixJ family response regulator